ncbi:TaxC (plasmid) [Pseudomonas antarctica]|uniref:TaxC n=1 Tax=Pseudomonas antarctica TaxID=219572 RepID=A0A172Z9Z2_9PSED|nr:MobP1 family relaxase [Pseudomonas antarctica]ANF89335.1 TaxC [Pseudomonas antarctica]
MAANTDKEWRIKRARSEQASKSAFAFKINQSNKNGGKASQAIRQLPSKEIMVKITGSATTAKGIKNTLDYISHDGELSLYDENGDEWKGEEGINELKESIVQSGIKAPDAKNVDEAAELKKQTHNIIFSPPPSEKVSREELLSTVRETLSDKYPNNAFVLAYHDNTEKPHVHAVLKISDKDGVRHDLKKEDLRQLRTNMSLKLQGLGYNVKATHKRDFTLKNALKQEPERTRNLYEVVEFGSTNYQFDKKNKHSQYITYKTISGQKEVTIWGKNLIAEIERKQVKVGSVIRLKKAGAIDVKVPLYDNNGEVKGYKDVKRNDWKIENTSLDSGQRSIAKPEKEINLHSPERQKKQMKQKLQFIQRKDESLKPKISLGFGFKL